MRFLKPWQPKSEQKPLTEEEEIAQTIKMLKKTSGIVSMNLKLAKMAGAGAIAILQSQMWQMIEQQVKEDIVKAKAKGEVLTVEKFMAKVDKITGLYGFYAKVDITKEDIRAKAEEIIIKGEVEKAEKGGLLNLAPLVAQKMKEGKGYTEAFKEAYKELTKE